jgi:hypothetical protein
MDKNTEKLIPLQVKIRKDVRTKLQKTATANGLSLNAVATMAIAAGMNMVEAKLSEINEPAKAA